MHARYSTVVRLCGILLLLLAVSPVTAPFSAWDPGVLYHDSKTHGSGASQVKTATDDPVLAPDGRLNLSVPYITLALVRDLRDSIRHGRRVLAMPLRI